MQGNYITINDLVVRYPTPRGVIRAVDGVSLEVRSGEILGLIGESGSGKTTLALSILGLIPRTGEIASGEITVGTTAVRTLSRRELRQYRWREVAMVFQSAMNTLDPVHTVGDQITETIRQHTSIRKSEALEKSKRLLESVGLDPSLVSAYPQELSGGMRQRVGIALSLCLNPKVLIADEPTTGLDVVVQAGILRLLKRLRDELGLTVILISHDLSIMGAMCDRIAVMYAGRIIEIGLAGRVIGEHQHPYTEALLNSILEVGRSVSAERIRGLPPDIGDMPSGCRFHPRCPYVFERCTRKDPPLMEHNGHQVACWLRENR